MLKFRSAHFSTPENFAEILCYTNSLSKIGPAKIRSDRKAPGLKTDTEKAVSESESVLAILRLMLNSLYSV